MNPNDDNLGSVEKAIAATQAANVIDLHDALIAAGRLIDEQIADLRDRLRDDGCAWVITDNSTRNVMSLRNWWVDPTLTHPEEWAWFDTRADAITAVTLLCLRERIRLERCIRSTKEIV